MKITGAAGSITEIGESDTVRASAAASHHRSGDHRQHGAQMRHHGQNSMGEIPVMYVPIASPGRPGSTSQILPEYVKNRLPATDMDGHVADQW